MSTCGRVLETKDLVDYLGRMRIPVKGAIAMTGHCNLQCRHCYVKCNWTKRSLDKETITGVVDQAYEAGCMFITLTGGEPLLHPDFQQIYRHIWKRGMKISLRTNGTLISDEICRLFRKYPPFGLAIGLYGLDAKTYEAVTGRAWAYAKVIAGLKRLKKRGIPFVFRALMLESNKRRPAEVAAFAHQWNAKAYFFTNITSGIDGDYGPNRLQLSPAEIIPFLAANYRTFPPSDALHDGSSCGNREEGWCQKGRLLFFVDCEGFLKPCQLSSIRADLKKHSFKRGWDRIYRAMEKQEADEEYARLNAYAESVNLCPSFILLQGRHYQHDYYASIAHLIGEMKATPVRSGHAADPVPGILFRDINERILLSRCPAGVGFAKRNS